MTARLISEPPVPLVWHEPNRNVKGLIIETSPEAAATSLHDLPRSAPARTPNWSTHYRRCLAATDFTIIVMVVFATQSLRLDQDSQVDMDGFGEVSYWLISTLLIAMWLTAVALCGGWDRKVISSGPTEYARVARASFYVFGLVAIVAYLAKAEIARSYLAIALPLGMVGLLAGRWVWRQLLMEYRRCGSHMSSVLVVGGARSATELATRLGGAPSAGFRVVGLCIPGAPHPSEGEHPVEHGFPVVGGLDDILSALETTGADVVAIAPSESFGHEEVRRLAWALEGLGVAMALAPGLADVAGPRIHIRPVAGLPLLYVEEPRFTGPKLVAKAATDFLGSLLVVVLAAPLLFVVALAIKIGDRGPMLFHQERVGIGNKHFRIWKFRSMVADAEARLGDVKDVDAGNEVLFKAKNDPRITAVGRLIRRFSIDELPQLFNVLRGEMSLVGPRPPLPCEVEKYEDTARRRLLVKPGITGLWQVSGRSNLSWEDTVRLDVYYVENWSGIGDLVIMARTIRAVLRGKGAY